MNMHDFLRLKKVMQQTFNENDSVALMALKKANSVLKENSLSWEDVFDKLVTVEETLDMDDCDLKEDTLNMKINNAFEILSNKKGNFINSLRTQWNQKHHLTKNQQDVLFEMAAGK